jgi:hypothetical protein
MISIQLLLFWTICPAKNRIFHEKQACEGVGILIAHSRSDGIVRLRKKRRNKDLGSGMSQDKEENKTQPTEPEMPNVDSAQPAGSMLPQTAVLDSDCEKAGCVQNGPGFEGRVSDRGRFVCIARARCTPRNSIFHRRCKVGRRMSGGWTDNIVWFVAGGAKIRIELEKILVFGIIRC